jgi:hypothetical protein
MFPHRAYSGRISYKHPDGSERGREWFSATAHDNGRAVRALCEIYAERLVRDVSWSLDAAFNPIEGYVRIVEDSKVTGSSWFNFNNDAVDCEAVTTAYGRVSQRVRSHAPLRFLGLHPLFGDGLLAAPRGIERPGDEDVINSVTCSFSVNGESGLIAHPQSVGVRYLGEEEVTVPAGTFLARHYQFRWQSWWAPADYWVFGDDYTFVQAKWSEFGTSSVLVEYNDHI